MVFIVKAVEVQLQYGQVPANKWFKLEAWKTLVEDQLLLQRLLLKLYDRDLQALIDGSLSVTM